MNFQELSIELGLSYTIKADSIDFANAQLFYDANNGGAKAITASFKSNSNYNNKGYSFLIYTNGTSYLKPTIVKSIKNQYIKYYNLDEGLITTINNYSSSTAAFSYAHGQFISLNIKSNSSFAPNTAPVSCGQAAMNCFADAYLNHGWASLWVSVQTLYLPATGAAIAGACIGRNCF